MFRQFYVHKKDQTIMIRMIIQTVIQLTFNDLQECYFFTRLTLQYDIQHTRAHDDFCGHLQDTFCILGQSCHYIRGYRKYIGHSP